MQGQKDLFPDLVAEEAKTGMPAGLPMVREKDIWANPDMLLPERHELWWDDGTAEPEWFVDRTWPVSNAAAVIQCLGGLAIVIGTASLWAVMLGDNLKQASPRWEHMPFDLSQEFGVKKQYPTLGTAAAYKEFNTKGDDEEDEEEE